VRLLLRSPLASRVEPAGAEGRNSGVFGLRNHYIQLEVVHHSFIVKWCIIVLFIKFGGMILFLILVLTN
jgi:hypothetical protein